MAGLFTHAWIANLVLQKLSKRGFISKFENIDDYFFGSVAPDIRYISGSGRDVTHRPRGENSIFEALKVSSVSMPFMAGYETHLVVDDTWANDNNSMGKSIYEYYGINANDPVQKFSLYFLVDDYFQGEADRLFPVVSAGNVFRANDYSILKQLGIDEKTIAAYKTISASYLREPGVDTFNILNFSSINLNEKLLHEFANALLPLSAFLRDLKTTSIENCLESLEKYV